jgi:HAD superfamily hydrolase (TIGR01549 family)
MSIWEKERDPTFMQNQFVKKYGAEMAVFFSHHAAHFEAANTSFAKNPELLEDLRLFKNTHKKFIWSSNSQKTVERVLSELNLTDYFDKIVAREDVQLIKADPEGFTKLYDPSVPKEQYLMIGDSSHDRGAAEAAGIDFYLIDFFKLGI